MTATTAGTLRLLGASDRGALLALTDRDPVAHCFVRSRIEVVGLDTWRLGAEMWGWFDGPDLVSALYHGANVVPVELCAPATDAFAERARRVGRRCSSIVGPAYDVISLWSALAPGWGDARAMRANQPLLAIDGPSTVAPDPLVRVVTPPQLDVLLPACVSMFTEEVGVSPVIGGAASAYRSRVAELIDAGRAFARIDDGDVVFKAEVGAVSRGASQVQGVWVPPARRGEGRSASGMSAVVDLALDLAPVVSLYVNDFNLAARALYERVGFTQVGTFATVLF